jgi:hypothetical protein
MLFGMGIFVWRDGGFYEKRTGKRMILPTRDGLATPSVISDIPEYRSPIDGKLITSRSQRREDLKANNCVDARDFPSPTGGKFRNKRFCERHGLPLSEEYR